ncbi:MAG TPA: hypothetical protein VF574_03665 [Allosphingosinicella sp.]|jgi:hypothetical protein
MALQFTADEAGAETEVFIHLDVEGLAALLRAIEAAMTTGRGELSAAAFGPRAAAGAAGGFGRVTVTFAGRSGPCEDAGPIRLRDAGPPPDIAASALGG